MAATGPELPPRYHAPELVAHGGMADVYRARDTALQRDVAIKVLAERYARDAELRVRFERESHTAARLTGEPHVVTIYDVGEADGRPYIVMELLEGGSLADRLRTGRPSSSQALAWLDQAAQAFDAAHRHGVVHRDVKPANLLLDRSGSLKVTDFGIASAVDQDTLTTAGSILGTWGYMAPEQARGEKASAASDRYALAAVAFELLTGTRPYASSSPTAEANAHVTAPIPRATSIEPSLPSAVDAVLARGLAKEPAARYDSCGELVAALRAAFHDAAGTTRAVAPVAPEPAPAPPPVRHRRRRVGVPVALAVLAAAAAAGAGVAALASGDEETAPQEPLTVVRTETIEGLPETTTVTVEVPTTVESSSPPPPPPPPPPSPQAPSGASGQELNDQGFALLEAGDYDGALPLLEQAVGELRGTGSLAEAYASYNLAFVRFALGSCDGVLELLDRSEQVQGSREPISRLRREAERSCSRGEGGDD